MMKRNPTGAKRVSMLFVAALLLLQVTAHALPFAVAKPRSSTDELRTGYGSSREQGTPVPLAAEPKTTSSMQAKPLAAAPADAGAPEAPSAAPAAGRDTKSESPVSAGVFYVIAGSALVVAGVSIGIYRRYKRNRAGNEEPREKNP